MKIKNPMVMNLVITYLMFSMLKLMGFGGIDTLYSILS